MLRWLRLDGAIPNDRRRQPRPGALRLSRLVPSDDGVYACMVNNTQGEQMAVVYLRIEGDLVWVYDVFFIEFLK